MSSCSAASRREDPPSTRAITRMRMSAEYAFGMARPPGESMPPDSPIYRSLGILRFYSARTCSSCHSSRRTGWAAVSVAVISLLFPGVAIIVVAKRLPEAGLILFHKTNSPDPFGTFPKIEMRHEQPSWTTMRWWNRQALIPGRDHPLTLNEIRDGDVCCVTPVAMRHDVGCGRLREAYRLQQIVKCHALPIRIEFRPFGDAVNINLDRRLRERLELCPVPFAEQRGAQLKSESPVSKFDLRSRPGGKNREIRRHILPGRQPVF